MPGHTLRLAIAGSDWPNCWPPPAPSTLGRRPSRRSCSASRVVDGLAESTHVFAPGDGPSSRRSRRCGVARLARRARARDAGPDPLRRPLRGRCTGRRSTTCTRASSACRPSIRARRGPRAAPRSRSAGRRRRARPSAPSTCAPTPTRSTSPIELVATRDGEPFATRSWRESFPRTF